jgi:hypothetical protein
VSTAQFVLICALLGANLGTVTWIAYLATMAEVRRRAGVR